jgi:hypothetical protein
MFVTHGCPFPIKNKNINDRQPEKNVRETPLIIKLCVSHRWKHLRPIILRYISYGTDTACSSSTRAPPVCYSPAPRSRLRIMFWPDEGSRALVNVQLSACKAPGRNRLCLLGGRNNDDNNKQQYYNVRLATIMTRHRRKHWHNDEDRARSLCQGRRGGMRTGI